MNETPTSVEPGGRVGDLVRDAAASFGHATFLETPDATVSFAEFEHAVEHAVEQAVEHAVEQVVEQVVEQAASSFRGSGRSRILVPGPESVADLAQFFALVRGGHEVLLHSRREPKQGVDSLGLRYGANRVVARRSSSGPGEGPPAKPPGRIVLFTSGSSGVPKGVVHSVPSLAASARGAVDRLAFGPGDRWGLTLPTHHAGGLALFFRALVGGGAVYMPGDPRDLLGVANRCTHLSLVPTQFRRLIEATGAECPTGIRRILLGGSAAPLDLIQRGLKGNWPLVLSYGMTETGSLVTATEVGELDSSGTPLPLRRLRIRDGEIEVGGEVLFAGYIEPQPQSPQHPQQWAFPPDGRQRWHRTGDTGYLDEKGCLHVTGRKDNMFISGGENIHPEVVEKVLLAIPGVQAAHVVPVSDDEFGFRPVAFLQTEGKRDVESEALASLRQSLPGYMIPVAVLPLGEVLPGSLKHRRADLCARAEEWRSSTD